MGRDIRIFDHYWKFSSATGVHQQVSYDHPCQALSPRRQVFIHRTFLHHGDRRWNELSPEEIRVADNALLETCKDDNVVALLGRRPTNAFQGIHRQAIGESFGHVQLARLVQSQVRYGPYRGLSIRSSCRTASLDDRSLSSHARFTETIFGTSFAIDAAYRKGPGQNGTFGTRTGEAVNLFFNQASHGLQKKRSCHFVATTSRFPKFIFGILGDVLEFPLRAMPCAMLIKIL